jgi:hypothetical protein
LDLETRVRILPGPFPCPKAEWSFLACLLGNGTAGRDSILLQGCVMMHTPILAPKLYMMLEKAIGLDVSIYVQGVQDAMMDGLLIDFDDDFVYIKSPDSIEAWRIDSLSGLVVFTPETEPKFEVVFGTKNKNKK